jgi:hypothetical protein
VGLIVSDPTTVLGKLHLSSSLCFCDETSVCIDYFHVSSAAANPHPGTMWPPRQRVEAPTLTRTVTNTTFYKG